MKKLVEFRPFHGTDRYSLQMLAVLLSTLTFPAEEYDNGFRWRDRYGNEHKPKDMSDRHLFYTWLMIWNHSVPARFTIWFSHKYDFLDYYTNEYMQQAFGCIYREMKRRVYKSKTQKTIEQIEKFLELHPELEEIRIKN